MSDTLKGIIDNIGLNADYSFIDADTIRDAEGNSYRIRGFDAPEISKLLRNEDGTPKFVSGTAGGARVTESLQRLAREQGFTNVVKMDEDAAYGRGTVDLQNDRGESFTRTLIKNGVVGLQPQSTQEDINAYYTAQLFEDEVDNKTDGVFKDTAKKVAQAIKEESYGDLRFKEQAVNELQYALGGDEYYSSNLMFDNPDRDLNNNALNPFSEAFDVGLKSGIESGYGVISLLGDVTNTQALKDIGDAGVARARGRIAENAQFLADYKDVDDFGDAMEFLGTNLAMSVPYMATTMLAVATAPATGGASLLAPVGLYTGQVWNEQAKGSKSATNAITAGVLQAALDAVGFKGTLGTLKGAPKEMFEQAATTLAKDTDIPVEVARGALKDASKLEIAKLAGDAVEVSKSQLKAKAVTMDLLKRVGKGVGIEGSTEAIQETIGYIGANAESGTIDFNELQERAMTAAIAGGALGGAFGTAGGIKNVGGWADVAWRAAPADKRNASRSGNFYEEEITKNGYVPTTNEITNDLDKTPEATVSFNDRVDADKASKRERTLSETVSQTMSALPKLWRGSTRWIFNPELQDKSRSARMLADLLGGNLQRIYGGADFENFKHHTASIYEGSITDPDKVYSALNNGKRPKRKERAEISKRIYDFMKTYVDDKGDFDGTKVPKDLKDREILTKAANDLSALSEKLLQDQQRYNPKLGRISNYFARYKTFDKRAIDKDQDKFIDLLVETGKVKDRKEAKDIVDAILDSTEVNDLAEAFSVTNGIPTPGSHKKRTLNLAEDDKFSEFMENDIYANVQNSIKAASRFQAYAKYVGKDGSKIAKLLDQMEAEGVSREEVNQVAAGIKDYLDAESGNYKRPTSEFGKAAMRFQKNFMLFTTIAGLPLATVSSIVELALTMKGLDNKQIFGKNGLQSMGKELGTTLWQGMQEVGSLTTGREYVKQYSEAQQVLRDLGFYDTSVGAAHKTGVTETSALKQDIINSFFKANGLQGWTQYTRAVRVAIAGDYIHNHLTTVMQNLDTSTMTNEVQQAREALRNLGIDPQRMAELYMSGPMETWSQANLDFYNESMREATFSFVNDAIVMPKASNRPLIYQDPRFALFNQFQGFISTFTATVIPKLWGEYVKRGSPAMKYNAFSVMATMILLGFVSQELKDRLKFGESSPYLDEMEWVRRGVSSSGLLGTSERIINTVFPIYETRTNGIGEWVASETIGQSPTLGMIEALFKGTENITEGEFERGFDKYLRLTPVGPITWARKDIASLAADDWDYKGE